MYIIGVDQSTQGTKALLFTNDGSIVRRCDKAHRQIVDERGWVEHDPEEIYANTIEVIRRLVEESGIGKEEIAGIGISNQRETALAWNRETGEPVYNAVVWQCARGAQICARIEETGAAETVRRTTGLRLSPYFSAAKLAWILENVPEAARLQERGALCMGNIDAWLLYKLTGGKVFATDYSNASRTQLFNVSKLEWDPEICALFGIDPGSLPQVTDSDARFGETDLEGFLERPVPIHGVLGDSHGALFGQGCLMPGMTKATYGTGSSIMMNIGERPVFSEQGVVTSLAWKIGGKVNYVLEGNINYTGAVITWLKDDVRLIQSAAETQELAQAANPQDECYLVPAFTGLGAPYWESDARAILCGMSRTTGKNEIVRAALDCIAYQIADIVNVMNESAPVAISELRADGGPTRNGYLMQMQSDILQIPVMVPQAEELSGMGAAYAAGLAMGFFDPETLFAGTRRERYAPQMESAAQQRKYAGWKEAVRRTLA
ncbi:MAG: glycerol kinase GlpK [Eubacteriales bacterium]|nr:glycerol kinase GlpK [Eubacteriales bacterium]